MMLGVYLLKIFIKMCATHTSRLFNDSNKLSPNRESWHLHRQVLYLFIELKTKYKITWVHPILLL